MAVTPFKSSDNFNMAGFNEKITEADNTYVAKTGDSMTGALSMGNNKITDVASPTSAGDVATKGWVDETLNEKVYDYLSEFNIPKTIDNCYIGVSSSSRNGTAVVTNYIGYSIVSVNVTTPKSGYSMRLFKSNNILVIPGFSISNQASGYVNISSGVNNQSALISVDSVSIPISNAGNSKYLFPFNLI